MRDTILKCIMSRATRKNMRVGEVNKAIRHFKVKAVYNCLDISESKVRCIGFMIKRYKEKEIFRIQD